MKILLIGPGKLKYMPYARFYLDNIDVNNHDVHLAYWNRDCKDEDISSYNGICLHEFRCFMNNDEPLKTKFLKFVKYRKFCKRIIREKFDLLIILHSLSGIMIYDFLKCRNVKYIMDYRDSTFESRNRLFANAVKSLVSKSLVTFVSSDSFRQFMPENVSDKIITSHNLLEDSLTHRNYLKKHSDKIRIAFWGFIRHVDINKLIINAICKDDRLELHYYGREQRDAIELKMYAQSIKADNVYFHGEYIPEDRYEFATQTDIIHNIYSGENENMAMGNKYYDSIIFRIPQICQKGSFMGRMSVNSGVGVELDPRSSDFCDSLVDYYKSINRTVFNQSCDSELNRILGEYKKGQNIIKAVLNKKI